MRRTAFDRMVDKIADDAAASRRHWTFVQGRAEQVLRDPASPAWLAEDFKNQKALADEKLRLLAAGRRVSPIMNLDAERAEGGVR